MNQSNTDPNEFISKLNSQGIEVLKKDMINKDLKIGSLTTLLSEANDKLSKSDNELLHKSKELELTVRELKLNLKMVEEDRDRIDAENTMLCEEIMLESASKVQKVEGSGVKNRLKMKIQETTAENEQAMHLITQLKAKSKKLKLNLQKSESINSHNILLLQTQFDKEQNKWEKERTGYQQEIHILKRKTMNLNHLLKKYQHNEALLNNSCFSCNNGSMNSGYAPRTPFGIINQCNDCLQRRQNQTCHEQQMTTANTCNCGKQNSQVTMQTHQKRYNRSESEQSDNEYLNPLLTQDSRQPTSKMFITYSETSRKESRASQNRHNYTLHQDTHSAIADKPELGNIQYLGDTSDNNPLIDSDSQNRESFDKRSRNSNTMAQSKSHNNLHRKSNIKFSHDHESVNENNQMMMRQHNPSKVPDIRAYEMMRLSSNDYNSSIHQCKATCSDMASSHAAESQMVRECNNYEFNTEIENCLTNGSETASSKFNGVNFMKENGFATYSNISTVPNIIEADAGYSSADEVAAELINKKRFEKPKSNNTRTYSQIILPQRYGNSFVHNELQVDTSRNAMMMKDI